jgi:MFS family permease
MIGMMGSLGVSLLGAVAGFVTDHFGPTIPILVGSLCLLCGYFTIYVSFVNQIKLFPLLSMGSCFAGFGSTLAYSASIKTAAVNFPNNRGTAVAFPLAGFGLSAFFFSSLNYLFFEGNTPGFLALLAGVTFLVCFLNSPFVVAPPPAYKSGSDNIQSIPERSEIFLPKPCYGTIIEHQQGSDDNYLLAGEPADENLSQTTIDLPNPQLASDKSCSGVQDPGREKISKKQPFVSVTNNVCNTDFTSAETEIVLKQEEHNVSTFGMLATSEFWVQTAVLGLLAGTGQMYIYCCGYIVRALAFGNSNIDPESIGSIQSFQVGLISICSFAGRLISGILSDFFTKSMKIQRLWMVFISSLFGLAAHLSMVYFISDPFHLWITSSLVGLSYGMNFGVFPTIVCDTFGIRHFSKNWGIVAMSPVLPVYIFNNLFGSIYDKNSSLESGEGAAFSSVCFKGPFCYSQVFQITSWISLLNVIIVIWMIYTEKHQALINPRRIGLSHNDISFVEC